MNSRIWTCGMLAIALTVTVAGAEENGWIGRWDLTVGDPPDTYPSWIGITKEGGEYRGRFVWEGGGVTDPKDFKIEGDTLSFEAYKVKWKGKLEGDHLSGTCVDKKGEEKKWVGRRFVPKVDVSGTYSMAYFVYTGISILKLVQKGNEITGEIDGRPISEGKLQDNALSFKTPTNASFNATVKGDVLEGKRTSENKDGESTMKFTAQRKRKWGQPIELFNGKDLDGWKPRGDNFLWKVIDGVMSNTGHGANIVSERKFGDFKLHVEFRIPEHSNSGVYLRGRYEIQVEDTFGKPLAGNICGAVYTRLIPKVNAAKKAGEWQTFDVTLIGQYVTVRHNDELTIDNQELEGITGGAIDSDEGSPGPVYLQGDHGAVDYRKITITPAEGG